MPESVTAPNDKIDAAAQSLLQPWKTSEDPALSTFEAMETVAMGRAVSLLKRFTARTATTETLESRMVYALTAIKTVAARCDTTSTWCG